MVSCSWRIPITVGILLFGCLPWWQLRFLAPGERPHTGRRGGDAEEKDLGWSDNEIGKYGINREQCQLPFQQKLQSYWVSINATKLPRPIPANLTQLLPVRLVIPHFGWHGSWHPLLRAGLPQLHPKLEVKISSSRHAVAGRLNIKFDVAEPVNIPKMYGSLHNVKELRDWLASQATRWYLLLTLCPFTVEWIHSILPLATKGFIPPSKVRVAVFYPIQTNYCPNRTTKVYDVMLASSRTAAVFLKPILPVISQFSYVLLKRLPEPGRNGTEKETVAEFMPTHIAPVPHQEKLRLYAQSKAAIVWNCYAVPTSLIEIWEQIPLWYLVRRHPAFRHLKNPMAMPFPGWSIIPQLKSRTFEAALAGSVLLAYWDPFKLIEHWFEPEKEFLYWYNASHLSILLTDIRRNYGRYEPIAAAAQRRVLACYSSQQFFQNYLSFVPLIKAQT